jgi:dienelactone hydrolase
MPLLVPASPSCAWRSLAAARLRTRSWGAGLFGLSMIGLGRLDLAGRDPRPRLDLGGGRALFEPALHAGRRGVLIPLILAYTAWSYWVFRGKVGEEGYHVRLLVQDFGFVVAAIDGPVHGDRRSASASPDELREEFRKAWDEQDTITPMVTDWRAVLDYLCRLPEVDPDAVGYYGISMGTAYGLPLVAAESRISRAVLGMWGLSRKHSDRLLADAGRIRCPLLFLQQWHDERFTREDQARLFDAFGSEDRRMYVYPGGHRDPDATRLADIAHFLTAGLAPGQRSGP